MRRLLIPLLSIIIFCNNLAFANQLKITFINPGYPGSIFWDRVTNVMQAAANDLDVDLEVLYASKDTNTNRFTHAELVRKVSESPNNPDYLITIFRKGSAKQILSSVEEHKLNTFIINTDVPAETKTSIGKPRENYKHWIGHIFPDDEKVGYDLANELIKTSTNNQSLLDNKIELIGISGNRHSVPALERNKGLKYAAREQDALLQQLVFSEWNYKISQQQTKVLLNRYPKTSVIWTANDTLALGAIEGAKDAGRTPGKDVFIGGVDWFPEALKAIEQGELAASAGGHFLEGACALVMLYDHHNGIDFNKNGSVQFNTTLKIINNRNISYYAKHLQNVNWEDIDFRQFSSALTPSVEQCNIELDTLFRQLDYEQ